MKSYLEVFCFSWSEGVPLIVEVDFVECSEQVPGPGSDCVDLPFSVTLGDDVGLKDACVKRSAVALHPVEVLEALFWEVRDDPVVVVEIVTEVSLYLFRKSGKKI